MNSSKLFLAAAVAFLCATACSDKLEQGSIDLTPKEKESETELKFSHPGAYVTKSEIDRVKVAVADADASDPVYACWKQLCESPYAQSTYVPSPLTTIVRGSTTGTGVDKENYIQACRDAAAAFQLALRWNISGEDKFASAAAVILNRWAAECTDIKANDNNMYLAAGFQGHAFANAAELLRTYSGWKDSDRTAFGNWLRDLWYAKNYWFIENHGGTGTCELHYWSNWELCNLCSILAIGIFLEDEDMVHYAEKRFKKGTGSGAIGNMIPFDPVSDPSGHGMIAQSMESGRDQGHATLVCSMCAELCQMAENVGLDFWGESDNKVLAMMEYTAKYNACPGGTYLTATMPFTPYSYCTNCSCKDHNHGTTHTCVSETGRGTIRPCWDLVYSHYVKEKGLSAYYTEIFARQLRYTGSTLTGDCGAGDSRYGSTSGAFDQLGWGTMLFYRGE